MARELQEAAWCDWHRLLPTNDKVPAEFSRINPRGKEIDLCDPCSMVYDWIAPRVEQMLPFFDRAVLEALFNTGNTPADEKRDRVPAQLAITDGQDTASAAEPAPDAKLAKDGTRRGNPRNLGRWIDGIDQVRCCEDHPGANSPAVYWVKVENRGTHASKAHHKTAQECVWEQHPDHPVDLPYKCREHKVCAAFDNGAGYGFPSAAALRTHIFKADEANWEKADKDPAETSASAA